MIYWATRDTKRYLDTLWSLRNGPAKRQIVTVAGGMGYLHTLDSQVASLHVVDRDGENLEHTIETIRLLKAAPSMEEFFAVIRKSGRCQSINWQGINLQGGVFNWLRGSYSFASEDTFRILQEVLRSVSESYAQASLEEIDYSACQTPGLEVFVSNCDCGFTADDAILKRISQTAQGSVRYVSWNRNMVIHANNQHHVDAVSKIQPLTKGLVVIEVKSFAGYHFMAQELQCSQHLLMDEGSLKETHGGPMLHDDVALYHISGKDGREEECLTRFFKSFAPHIRRFIVLEWLRRYTVDRFVALFHKLDLHKSYTLRLDWSGGKDATSRSMIAVLDLRGATFPG